MVGALVQGGLQQAQRGHVLHHDPGRQCARETSSLRKGEINECFCYLGLIITTEKNIFFF